MDSEKLEKMIKMAIDNLSGCDKSTRLYSYPTRKAEIDNLMSIGINVLPDHITFFLGIQNNYKLDINDVYEAIYHILAILEIEKASEKKIRELKIFEGASEKLKQANISFRKDDYASAFHNLNTTLELILKDKIGIPLTITKINTSNIIDILVKHKIEPYLYLAEARKRVLMIDNKIKHQAYSATKIECINGIKAMEELISKLRDKEIKLNEESKNKIYEGL